MRFIDDGRQRRPCEPGGGASNEIPICEQPETRRTFIKQVAGTSVAIAIGPNLVSSALGDQSVSTSTTAIERFSQGESHDQRQELSPRYRSTCGIGEIGIVGAPAAVANAVFNATGKRVRDLPITPDKLI